MEVSLDFRPVALAPALPAAASPRASVIVVNYNGRPYLEACLSSLLEAGPADTEIILLDNASTDGSAEYVAARFPAVHVLCSAANAGFAGGNNQAAAVARGAFLAFVNPDTRVEAGWLEALLAALEADPSAGLATSRILMLADPGRINTCGNNTHCSGLTMCRGAGCDSQYYDRPGEVSAVSGAAFAMRRDLFEALGGFDPRFFLYMEDTDLSLRARLAGYTCLYVPSSVVYHDYKLRFGPNKTFYQERNRYLMLLKLYRWPTLLALLPTYVLAEIVTWGFVLTRDHGRAGNKLRGYAWVPRHWREIMASRRTVQALRRSPDRALLARCTAALPYEQTGGGLIARGSHLLFDPLFGAFHRFALAVVRW
ncbi:MAG TPA: glycosyltransferase family 2 protein [Anaerolineae bacterium]